MPRKNFGDGVGLRHGRLNLGLGVYGGLGCRV